MNGHQDNAPVEAEQAFAVASTPPRAPVLFLVFNRPDVTAQVFDAIRAARPPRLYVAADGPRPGRHGEADLIAQTRAIATDVDWPCEIKTLFRDVNLGCKMAVSGAITWFFEQEESGIILEDDCLPAPCFFPFCEALLERYKDDTRIWHVGGTNALASAKSSDDGYYFSRYCAIWGWATWRRAWVYYDVDIKTWPEAKHLDLLNQVYVKSAARHYSRLFSMTFAGKIDTWDFQWQFICAFKGLAVAPTVNLISNIGFGTGATHTTDSSNPLAGLPTGKMQFPLRHPMAFVTDRKQDMAWERFAFRRRPIRLALIRIREAFRAIGRRFAT